MAIQFKSIIKEHQTVLNQTIENSFTQKSIDATLHLLVNTFANKGQVLLCGNGGSAADAEHLAGELSGRFKVERAPLNADALHVNSAALTAISNDYGYDFAYARILEAKGKAGDVLLAFSTSGSSKNILLAMAKAKLLKMTVVAFCGNDTTLMSQNSDLIISVPSHNTPRIQEAHMVIGHYICEAVENKLFHL